MPSTASTTSAKESQMPTTPATFGDFPTVRRYAASLADRTPAERGVRLATLHEFCAATGSSPDGLVRIGVDDCGPIIAAAERHQRKRVVESFLIHNGINVFGPIVCMPRTKEQLREQGWA